MIHQSFPVFLTLLILGLVATIVMHSIIRYRHLKGLDGFLSKWILAYIGAWIGQPVLGYWGSRIYDVHWIPAIIGAFAGAFGITALWKARAKSVQPAKETTPEPARSLFEHRAA
jgi:uncharacterized membrane protein YeaQ/YmgE (transglycosylase-associated protein family)